MPVTAERIRERLNSLSIPFEEEHYDNRYALWQALEVFPDTKEQPLCPVLALVIRSSNGKMDLSLAFEHIDGEWLFYDLFFGPHDYEFFTLDEEYIEETLIDTIAAIMKNETAVIYAVDPKRQEWLWDGSFDMGDPDPHDRNDFERMLKKLEKPKGWLSRLMKRQIRYDVYDWNTYRCIIK